MLSYQHAFHAGNHADVVKHVTICALLRALTQKPKPFFYLDTHAGNGCYELQGQVQQDEVAAFALSPKDGMPVAIADYLEIVGPYLEKGSYPGSPLVASDLLALLAEERNQGNDSVEKANLQLCELHPSAFASLKQWMSSTNFHCHQRDAFELLNALMPPKPNRGLVVIDPPYEQAGEYEQVVKAITKALDKWRNGIFCIWYPLLSPQRIDRVTQNIVDTPKHGLSEKMLNSFTQLASESNVGLVDVQFAHQAPSVEMGMYGSGMLIINPPWQFESQLKSIVAYLQQQLVSDENKLSTVTTLVPSP